MRAVARTVWGEARGEGLAGMQAVAHCIVNRYRAGYAPTLTEIVLAPHQFSAWNTRDENRVAMLTVTMDDFAFKQAMLASLGAITGVTEDPTGGATHFHTLDVQPQWASRLTHTVTVKSHRFYR